MGNIEDIQDLINRAEKFLNRNNDTAIKEEERFTIDETIKDIEFCDEGIKITHSNNVLEKYIITEQEAKNGCAKTITYMKRNRFNKEIETSIDFEIPKGIKNGENIVIKGKGNYYNNELGYTDLIIKIIIR